MSRKANPKPNKATQFDKLVEDVEKILGFNTEVDELAIKLLQKIADWYPQRSIEAIRSLDKMAAFHSRPHEVANVYEALQVVHHRHFGRTESNYGNAWDDAIRAIEDYGGDE